MDIEKAKEIHASQNWAEICEEINLRIKNEEKRLRICLPEQLKEVQMKLSMYEEFKRLPQDVIDREEYGDGKEETL